MKLNSLVTLTVTVLAAVSAHATKYTWKTEVKSGTWCNASNWETDDGSSGYPNDTSATVSLPKRGGYAIDLEGRTIQLSTGKWAMSFNVSSTEDGPVTLRNGVIKTGRVDPTGDVVLDGVAFTDNYCQPAASSHVVFTGTSPAENNELVIAAAGVDCEILGNTLSGRGQCFGTEAAPATLTVSNATLTFSSTLANVGDCVLRFLDGGCLEAKKLRMKAAARVEVGLREEDASTPRISTTDKDTMDKITFAVTSSEKPGKYPLIRIDGYNKSLGEELLKKCELDLSALSSAWSGTLECSEDGKTILAWLHRDGMILKVR